MRSGIKYGCGCLLSLPFAAGLLVLAYLGTGGGRDLTMLAFAGAGLAVAFVIRWVRGAGADDPRLSAGE